MNESSAFDDVVAAYLQGDPLAVSEVERAARYLALGITNCVNLVNPDLVIIGDEYTALGEPFRAAVHASLTELLLPSMAANLTLQLSDIEGDLVLRGSFLDVLSQSFFSPRRFNGAEIGSRAASDGSHDLRRVAP